ncbi:alpha/beta-hydrolase [Gloeophyllum trabeum ATCC 11539]|uniref:Dipeptidyl-peptidase V n=1 Tax=Gloeophyllum trabeum (strain ATCC 11539 / FP-39264 / Madison 617) TaxID=670483 RepID=S7RJQ4_GLOTA|nr:alpha/beta-hydrolase [Gloeophyllum trabeum ATCC 11539]EPQ54580.1 alpha/beta-hydrolase [Gloeophyllum trabeum ATCC 11539]
MRFPLSLLGFAQVPLEQPQPAGEMSIVSPVPPPDFSFKEGVDVFSPKDLVELARPGTAAANDAGDLVLVPVSKFSLEEKKNNKTIVIASVDSTVQPLEIPLARGGTAFWLDSRTVGHVFSPEEGKPQELYAISVKFEAESNILSTPDPPAPVGEFPTSTSANFQYSSDSGILVFSDEVYADGQLETVKAQDEAWENRGNTALVYDSTYERHWDHWIGPKKSSLFSVSLYLAPGNKWIMGRTFLNILKDTGHHVPVEPFGGTDDFDIGPDRIIYTTKAPDLPEAWHTKQNVYIVAVSGAEKPRELTSGKQGATHSPVWSKQGNKVAWLEQDKDGYESDRSKVVVYDLEKDVRFTITQHWDRSPDSIVFSKSGKSIIATAGDRAKIKVFILPVPPTPSASSEHPALGRQYTKDPVPLIESGSSGGLQIVGEGRVIFTRSCMTSPNDVWVVKKNLDKLEDMLHEDANATRSELQSVVQAEQITRFTGDALSGKTLHPGSEFYFEGAEGKQVQGWLLTPPGFQKGVDNKKWPVVMLIHGGPQGAWEDQWSTRWNPNVFANQGYVVVAMNPTGSTTFGQEFTDAITEDWGGKPFVDMQKGWKYVLEHFPEIDSNRAVAAGASWGGYAINWIQGHPEYGFGFKALFCHDGVFDSIYNGYSTDELFFFNHDWGSAPYESKARELAEKFSPVNFVHKWSTPQLTVHGSKDYRLPETDGIGAFHALQGRGIPSRLVIFPDENHWVLNHGNSLKWHYEVFRWFDKYVGRKD